MVLSDRANIKPRHPWLRRLAVILLCGFIALNMVACMQARALTSYVAHGQPLQQLRVTSWPARLKTLLLGARVPRPENVHTPADHHLPFEERAIALSDEEHLAIWYVPHPQPRGIVLLFPGYAVPKDSLLTPAAYFHRFGLSSVLVDFRGAGGSTGSQTTLGMDEAEDVAATVRYAAEHWPEQPVILYGVSMGSSAILRAVAIHDVRPTALILEGPFDRLLTTTKHRFAELSLPSFPAAELLLLWGSVQMGDNGFTHNPVEYAALNARPTLILHGEQDPWIRTDEVEAVAEAMQGPAEVVHFPALGHEMPFVYAKPEAWEERVRAFLDTVLMSQ